MRRFYFFVVFTLVTFCTEITFSQTTTITIGDWHTGWYQNNGYHDSSNTNYLVGPYNGRVYHNFFIFNLNSLPQNVEIISAQLSVISASSVISSSNATYTLFNVSSNYNTVRNSSGSISIWNDLGSGPIYGSYSVNNSAGYRRDFSLNQTALNALESQAGNYITIGGRITSGNGYLFGGSGYGTQILRITYRNNDVPPVINCPSDFFVENIPESCGAIVSFEATDTEGIPASTITYSHQPGDFFPVGTTTVTATATNAVGSTSCEFDVVVEDTEAPEIECTNFTNIVTDYGACTLTITNTNFDIPFTDNCSASVVNDYNNSNTLIGAVLPIGQTYITWTATDNAGNSDVCSQLIEVISPNPIIYTVSPSNYSPGDTVVIAGNFFTDIDNTVTMDGIEAPIISQTVNSITVTAPLDICSGMVTVTNGCGLASNSSPYTVNAPFLNVFTPNDLSTAGNQLITLDGTDFNSNSTVTIGGQPGLNVSVLDSNTLTFVTPPDLCEGSIEVISCGQVSNSLSYTMESPIIASVNPSTLPYEGGVEVVINGSGFSASNNTVSFNGVPGTNIQNEGFNSITVTAPAGLCSGSIVVTTACGTSSESIAFEVFPPSIVSINPSPVVPGASLTLEGINFNPGQNSVTINGFDAPISSESFNSITVTVPNLNNACAADIVVTTCNLESNIFSSPAYEQELPTLVCPANINAIATSAAGAVVSYTAPVGTDNCTGATTSMIGGLASGDTFPIGDTVVAYEVTDTSGNSAQCSFVVTVVGVAPEIVCPATITVSNDAGQCGAVVTFEATDIVGIPASTITYDYQSGDFFPVGTTTVTATATNAVGTSICTFDIVVNDTEAPVVSCQDITIALDENGQTSIDVSDINGGASDNCGISDLSFVNGTSNNGLLTFNFTATVTSSEFTSITNGSQITGYYSYDPNLTDQNTSNTFNGWYSPVLLHLEFEDSSVIEASNANFFINNNSSGGGTVDEYSVRMDSNPTLLTGVFAGLTWDFGRIHRFTYDGDAIFNDQLPTIAPDLNLLDGDQSSVRFGGYDYNEGSFSPYQGIFFNINSITQVESNVINFNCDNLGDNNINLNVTDNNGNISTCTANVTVIDNIAPNITCPPNINTIATSAAGTEVTYTAPVGTDNCTPTTTLIAGLESGSTFPIGDTTVTYEVTDVSGNSTQCSFVVTVVGVAPEIVCPNTITVSNDIGQCGALVSFEATDAVGIPASTITYSHQPGDFFPVGTTTVTATATNAVGSTSCEFDVVVNDTEAPLAICQQGVVVLLDDNGIGTLAVEDLDGGSTDNCGIASISVNPSNFDCSQEGQLIPVALTVIDIHGNSSTCVTDVEVDDIIPPTAVCQNITIALDHNGQASIAPSEVDGGSFDNCGFTNPLSVTPNSFDCSNIGTNMVTLLIGDGNGNQSTCTAIVTVQDNIAPEITCVPNTTFDTDPGVCDYTVVGSELDATFTDNCASGSITNDYNNDASLAGAIFQQGTTLVTWTVDDGNGQVVTCTTEVTVEDNEAPVVNCLSLQVQLDEFGNGSISEEDINGDSTDNCEIASIELSQLDFDCSDIGGDLDGLIISEYVDGAGDNDCIEIFNGTGNTVNLYGDNYVLRVYADGGTTALYEVPLLGSIADRDVYVLCFGNNDGASQADQIDGFAFDGNDAVALVKDGNAVDVVGVIGNNPGTGWSSGGVSTAGTTLVRNVDVLQGNINAFVANLSSEWTQFPQGTYGNLGAHDIEITDLANNVILTVTDTSGNVSTCEGNVTVVDLVPPVPACQDITVQLGIDGTATVAPSQVDNGSTDVCGIATLELNVTEFDCSNIGANPVVLTVTDVNGNTATCSATVTIEDNVAPTVVTQNITVQLDDQGNASIEALDVDGGSTDACGIESYAVTPNSFDCSNIGENTVTLTVTDIHGNAASETAVVTVEDMVNPIAVCNDISIYLNADGTYTLSQSDIDAIADGSTDNCDTDLTYSVSPDTFTCAEEGDNTVTLTVTDDYGNSSTCTATVTVDGSFPEVTISQSELPEFCQGAVVVLTANSDEAVEYLWNSGEETASIEVGANGIYGVLVTSATNCTAYAEFEVTGFDAGALVAAYTILAEEDVYLHGNNLVQTGAVGAMDPNIGNIRLHQATTVVDFGQAVSFDLNQGSTIGSQVFAPANPTIPAFVYNTLSNAGSPDATVNNNQTQTLNGSVYDVVTVKQNATVIFTQSNVYINELNTFDGASIEFENCANVFINEKFMLAQNGTINADDPNKVVFYVNQDVQIEKGSYVRASIHAYFHELLVKGDQNGAPTYMTGLFIANRVHGNKNTVWNADDLCDPCPVDQPVSGGDVTDSSDLRLGIDMEVTAWPNPSKGNFNLKLKTAVSTENVDIKVYDMNNRLVHKGDFGYDGTHVFGDKLDGGVYIVKVTQSGITKSVRLVRY